MDVKAHLLSRGLRPERYRFVVTDDDEGVAWFALWNLSGQLVGYQQYRPDGDKKNHNDPKSGKYYTYAKDNIAVWGLETLEYRHDVLFLTEGIFDAVKLHDLNLPAIAVLANNPRSIRPWLNSLARTTVGVCDNDPAGKALGKLCDHALHCTTEKDLGAMTPEEVREFVKFYCPLVWVNHYER